MGIHLKSFSDSFNFFSRLRKTFGNKLLIFLASVFFFQEGLIFSLVYLNQLPYYKDVLKINEATYQTFFIVTLSPWTMKGITGAISDLFPLFGYHKISYMLITGLIGTVSLAAMATIKIEQSALFLAPMLGAFLMLELSIHDLLSEARYTEIMFEKKIEEGDVISWVWICRIIGQLVGGSIIGAFVSHFHPRNIYWICFAASFPTLFLILFNYLGDPHVASWHRNINAEKFKKQKKLFILSVFIAFAAIGIIVVNVIEHDESILGFTILISLALIILGYVLLPKPLAHCNFYIFVQEAVYFRIMGALDYWYTSDGKCVPGGPHFDLTFYLTVTQVIACISGIIGIFIFQSCTRTWTFRFAFMFSIFVRIMGSFFDLFITTRMTTRLGLSDRAVFIFGDAIIMDAASMIVRMSATILTARLVKRGYESTTYAVLSGFHDIGKNIGISFGKFATKKFGISFNEGNCQTQNIPYLIALSHLIMPLLAVPFVFALIPSIRLGDVSAFDKYKVDEQYGDVLRVGDTGNSDSEQISGAEYVDDDERFLNTERAKEGR